MSIDITSFLYEEVKKLKKKLDEAISRGDATTAAGYAKRIAELLREIAKRKYGSSRHEYEELAKEYEELYRRLSSGYIPSKKVVSTPATPRPSPEAAPSRGVEGVESEVSRMDREFELEAEKLIARADVTWDDIAGLHEVKRALMEALFFSIAKPEVPVKFEPPRRFLLFGPPGTGKTMLAMAASNMLKATFFSVSVDRVLSRYVGDSPRMISAIFRVAYRRAPSVIFFDEIEVLVMKRDSGREVATGVVQTFLTELDGFKSKQLDKPVIVMAATNKPWVLDEAILSRFEKRIYVPLPDREARKEIFRLHLEKKGFEIEGITYDELADLTEGYSGRDIRNVCQTAIMMMLRRANPDIESIMKRITTLEEAQSLKYRVLPIKREELLEAIRRVKPAVTKEEIARYEEWARQFGAW